MDCLGKGALYFTPEDNATECAGARIELPEFFDDGRSAGICLRHARRFLAAVQQGWLYERLRAAGVARG